MRFWTLTTALSLLGLPACFLVPSDKATYRNGAHFRADTPYYLRSTQLALAGDRSCALTAAQELYCWGKNDYGIVGKMGESSNQAFTPQRFSVGNGTDDKFLQVAQNQNNLCALDLDGRSFCRGAWGNDYLQQAATAASEKFLKISMAQDFGCGILSAGNQVACFGNHSGGRPSAGTEASLKINHLLMREGFSDHVRAILVLDNDEILVGGDFTHYSGIPTGPLLKLRPDGTLNQNFTFGQFLHGGVFALAKLSDGSVVVGGNFTTDAYIQSSSLVKINPNLQGIYDVNFDDKIKPGFRQDIARGTVYALAVDASNRILIGGNFNRVGASAVPANFVRIQSNGLADSTFSPVVNSGFTNGGERAVVYAVAVLQPGNEILVGGDFGKYQNFDARSFVKLSNNGNLDLGFVSSPPKRFDDNAVIRSIQFQGSNIIVGGEFSEFNDQPITPGIARFSGAGVHDGTFGNASSGGFDGPVHALQVVNADQSIYAVGAFSKYQGVSARSVVKLALDGARDESFRRLNGGATTATYAATLVERLGVPNQPDLMFGDFSLSAQGMDRQSGGLAKLDSSGAPISTFGYTRRIRDLQSAGNGACALVYAEHADRPSHGSLHCWGMNGFAHLKPDSDVGSVKQLSSAEIVQTHVQDFRLYPSQLCYREWGGDWRCRGANYSELRGRLSSSIGDENFLYDQLSSAMSPPLEAVDFMQGKYRVAAGLESELMPNFSSVIGEAFFELPFGCRLNGEDLQCQGYTSAEPEEADNSLILNRRGLRPDGNWASLPRTRMVGPRGIKDFALGKNHGCLISEDSIVHCWGDARHGQFGPEMMERGTVWEPLPLVISQ